MIKHEFERLPGSANYREMKPEIDGPLIPNDHQMEYNVLAPYTQTKIRVLRLRRKGTQPLGFSIRGGCEHGTGIFVSDVQLGTEAERQGLKVGDQIMRINGFNIEQAIHEEVLNLLRSKPGVVLKVKSVGMIPVKNQSPSLLTELTFSDGEPKRRKPKLKTKSLSTPNLNASDLELSSPHIEPSTPDFENDDLNLSSTFSLPSSPTVSDSPLHGSSLAIESDKASLADCPSFSAPQSPSLTESLSPLPLESAPDFPDTPHLPLNTLPNSNLEPYLSKEDINNEVSTATITINPEQASETTAADLSATVKGLKSPNTFVVVADLHAEDIRSPRADSAILKIDEYFESVLATPVLDSQNDTGNELNNSCVVDAAQPPEKTETSTTETVNFSEKSLEDRVDHFRSPPVNSRPIRAEPEVNRFTLNADKPKPVKKWSNSLVTEPIIEEETVSQIIRGFQAKKKDSVDSNTVIVDSVANVVKSGDKLLKSDGGTKCDSFEATGINKIMVSREPEIKPYENMIKTNVETKIEVSKKIRKITKQNSVVADMVEVFETKGQTDDTTDQSQKKDPVTWKIVEPKRTPNGSLLDGPNLYGSSSASSFEDFVETQLIISGIGAPGIGCTIVKGPPDFPGIFVQTVKAEGLAERSGFDVGDQIVRMNGHSFLDVDFTEAVSLMKSSKELRLTVRKGVGMELFPEEKSRRLSALLNGVGHITKEEEPKNERVEINGNAHLRQNSFASAATATVTTGSSSERDFSMSDASEETGSEEAGPRNQKETTTQESKKAEDWLEQERRLIEKEQKKLKEEAKRLAEERRQLEELRSSQMAPAPPPMMMMTMPILTHPPSPALGTNFLTELQNKQLNPISQVNRPDSDSEKYKEEIVKRQQHEKLMEEFQQMHKRMFGTQPVDFKPRSEPKPLPPPTECISLAHNRRQRSVDIPPPPPVPHREPEVFEISKEDLEDHPTEEQRGAQPLSRRGSLYIPPLSTNPHMFVDPNKSISQPAIEGSRRGPVIPTLVRPVPVNPVPAATQPLISSPPILIPTLSNSSPSSLVGSPPMGSSPVSPLTRCPITDSRGPAPKPPQTYFDRPSKGPLVTIGVYPDNSRANRFHQSGSLLRKGTSPGPSVMGFSVSMTSASDKPATNKAVNCVTLNKSPNPIVNGEINGVKDAISNKVKSEPKVQPSLKKKEKFDPYKLFAEDQIAGRELKIILLKKNGTLNMKVEGGSTSDPEGRVLVSEVWPGGCIPNSAGICRGDQLMMVDDRKILGVTLTLANALLRDALTNKKDDMLRLVIAKENSRKQQNSNP